MVDKFLKEKRSEANLSELEAAEKLGVDTNLLKDCESGKNIPEEWQIDRLSELYDVPRELIISQIEGSSPIKSDHIFSEALYKKIEAMDDKFELFCFDLGLNNLQTRALISVAFSSALGVNPYTQLNKLIPNPDELEAVVLKFMRFNLIEYCAKTESFRISEFGSFVVDVIEKKAIMMDLNEGNCVLD